VRSLCEKGFLSDFTVQSPKYRKLAGPHKEAADVLVFFEGSLIVIQVKAKKLTESPSELEMSRFMRTLKHAQDQFRALIDAFGDQGFGSFINARGEEFTLDRGGIKKAILIVVFATVRADGTHTDLDIRPIQNCVPYDPIPLFTFNIRQFKFLLTLANTLPDFLLYLDCHYLLSNHELIPDETQPHDVWALMTFERKLFLEVLHSKQLLSLDGLLEKHSASLERMEAEEKPGYFIDWFIEELHQGIGLRVPMSEQVAEVALNPELSGTLQAYRQLIPYFAKLNRANRARLVSELLERIERCIAEDRLSFGGAQFGKDEGEAYLVMASPMTHSEMQIPLINAAHMLAYKLNVRKIICISTSKRPVIFPT
jgi:hypothetical protein